MTDTNVLISEVTELCREHLNRKNTLRTTNQDTALNHRLSGKSLNETILEPIRISNLFHHQLQSVFYRCILLFSHPRIKLTT